MTKSDPGILLIDKPKGMTSHDVVDHVRKVTGERRVGHAGTLDPNASGLLILGVGREATKTLNKYLKLDKSYEAKIKLGEDTDTDDDEGKKTLVSDRVPSLSEIVTVLRDIEKATSQIPPSYSALKVKGVKAYEAARAGKPIDLKERPIKIYELKLMRYEYPYVEIACSVSSGTYIRSIARDLGKGLTTGAYLIDLMRTRIGEFTLEQAQPLNEFTKSSTLIEPN